VDLVAICVKIAEAAGAVEGLNTSAYVPDSITEPHFFVAEHVIDYDRTFGRTADLEIICRVLISRSDDEASQELLRTYLSTGNAKSIKDAIEAARGGPGQPALDGEADDLWVRRAERPRWYEHGGVQYVGCDITIKVVE
jgi:hypothetical protein